MRLSITQREEWSLSMRFAFWPKEVWADKQRKTSVWIFWEPYISASRWCPNYRGVYDFNDYGSYIPEAFECSPTENNEKRGEG